jgi:hypothetical protein
MTIAVAGTLVSPSSARSDTVGIIVPAYFYPGTGGTEGYTDGWAQMAAAAGKVPIAAIMNPDSGPLPGPADPNYVTALTNLENAGGRVVAYVPSQFGSAPLSTVESEIQTYLTQYGHLINGFFIDQMNIVPSTLSYYQSIDSYIKGQGTSYEVIGNPGSPFLNGVSPADYLSTADVLNIFEGPNTAPSPGAPGFDAYPYGLNWFQSYSGSQLSNIVFAAPTDLDMLADVSQAVQLNAGSLYVTDQTQPNPYAQLPSYWNEEVSALQSLPEPGALVHLASAAMCCSLAVAARRLGRKRNLAR